MSQRFQNAKEDSTYGRLYKNKMNGLKSFFEIEDGLKHLVKREKIAFIADGDIIRAHKHYQCKV